MDKEKIFKEFLEEYLENVKRELPSSYRAQQLENGGMEALSVYTFETMFLKEPFSKALEKVESEFDDQLKELLKEIKDLKKMV